MKIYKTVERIVSKVMGLDGKNIFERNRHPEYAKARFMFCFVMYDTGILKSGSALGRLIERNHTCVYHGFQRHQDYIFSDRTYKENYGKIIAIINRLGLLKKPDSDAKTKLLNYIYEFAAIYGEYYHNGDAENILEKVGEKIELPEKFLGKHYAY